jgi:copper chaperone
VDLNAVTSLHAPDIECEHCAAAIRDALTQVDGVHRVEVDLEACTVRVEHKQGQVPPAAIRAALEDAGYPTLP